MSKENTNTSASSYMRNRSPEPKVLIEWYDSPKIVFPSQANMNCTGRLTKTRSADDFSPSRSSASDTPSTSDFDSLWCGTSPEKEVASFGVDGDKTTNLFNAISYSNSTTATPRRRLKVNKPLRRRTLKTEELSSDEKKTVSPEKCLSMEEALAIGKASLVKLRQRLHSEGDTSILRAKACNSQSDPFKAVPQCSPNVSPISSIRSVKRNVDVVLTPSMARTQPSKFQTSTPKSTSLKRCQTMNDSTVSDAEVKNKMARAKSMNIVEEASDDDSFVDDIFVPFTHPSQFVEMLKQGFVKR